jgi:hypothetical protein
MSIFSIILTISGLCLFETVSSIDNAIINAGVLTGMGQAARRWFLSWGILFAVFVIRGFLPWVIVWSTAAQLGFWGAFTATFSGNAHALVAIEKSSPVLLIGGGVFLVFLFFHWLFLEEKYLALRLEKFFYMHGSWFYAGMFVLLIAIAWFALLKTLLMGLGVLIGAGVFFITHGLKKSAEQKEKELSGSPTSDISKLLYLEIIDATFSIDGVLGAFAFTFSLPLILIGNGLGALVVRQLTVGSIQRIRQYKYLKNGAMYSVFFLGLFMILKSFGLRLPEWISPVVTLFVVGIFFRQSCIKIRQEAEALKNI